MPTSKKIPTKIRVLIWILIFILLNVLFSFLLEPYRSSSDEMWKGFEASGDVNVIITGSSQAMCSIDPDILDEKLGTSSYNMATNMQSLQCSKEVIEAAIAEKNINAVLLVIDYELLDTDRTDNYRAEASFHLAKGRRYFGSQRGLNQNLDDIKADRDSNAEIISGDLDNGNAGGASWVSGIWNNLVVGARFVTDSDFIGSPVSLTYFFPWTYNRSNNVALNVREKLAGQVLDEEGHRTAKGYEFSEEELGEDMVSIKKEEAEQWSAQEELLAPSINAENEQTLQEICALCEKNNVNLYLFNVPVWNCFSVYEYDAYLAVGQELAQLAGSYSYGYTYTDFNVDPELRYQEHNEWFKDVGHLNRNGSVEFTNYLAGWLMEQQ